MLALVAFKRVSMDLSSVFCRLLCCAKFCLRSIITFSKSQTSLIELLKVRSSVLIRVVTTVWSSVSLDRQSGPAQDVRIKLAPHRIVAVDLAVASINKSLGRPV